MTNTTQMRNTTEPSTSWSLIVAVNNEEVLKQTLLASPAVDSSCQVIPMTGYKSAAEAYNAGLKRADHELVVFAHQDVYLPGDWLTQVDRAVTQLNRTDPEWGVLGLFGVQDNPEGTKVGYCYSTGLGLTLGAPFSCPIEATSLDELVLIVRRSSNLSFDERLPGFHFYGTDICLTARELLMKSYIISAFCIHNSNGIQYFPREFWRGYAYMRNKWRNVLPVTTCCTRITASWVTAARRILKDMASRVLNSHRPGRRCDDVQALYRKLSGSWNCGIEKSILEVNGPIYQHGSECQ